MDRQYTCGTIFAVARKMSNNALYLGLTGGVGRGLCCRLKQRHICVSNIRILSVRAFRLLLTSPGTSQGRARLPRDRTPRPRVPGIRQSRARLAPFGSQTTGNDCLALHPRVKTDKEPRPSIMDNIDAIGNRNVGCNKGMGNWYSLRSKSRWAALLAAGRARRQADQRPGGHRVCDRVGQNLVRDSDSKVPFTIKVIDDGRD